MSTDVGGAVRIDRSLGIREEVRFFGTSGKRYGWQAHPLSAPLGALVVCSTIHADAVKQYRREVLFGRDVAAAGFAVQRFHYRGFGNSDGDGADATFATMRDDAVAAADELRERTGVAEPLFLGIGWGGLIAAEVIRSQPTPVALWQPALDASSFFAAGMRARAIHDLKEGRGSRSTEDDLIRQIREEGSLDVLGYSIDRALFDSSREVGLAAPLLERPRKVLVLQVAKAGSLQAGYRELAGSLSTAGSEVDVDLVEAEDRSWFIENEWRVEEDRASTRSVIDRTKAWMLAVSRTAASA
jgi:pimeloyl-ACP methyl ester carboxylesterase